MATLTGLSILLVEDDDDVREVLVLALGRAGASVHEAVDYATARAHVAAGGVELVVSDLHLQRGENGCELLRILRRDRPADRMPAVLLTGTGDAETFQDGRRAGFDLVLAKPVELELLLAATARLARGLRLPTQAIAREQSVRVLGKSPVDMSEGELTRHVEQIAARLRLIDRSVEQARLQLGLKSPGRDVAGQMAKLEAAEALLADETRLFEELEAELGGRRSS